MEIELPKSVVEKLFKNENNFKEFLTQPNHESTFNMLEDLTLNFDLSLHKSEELCELSFACFETLKGSLARNDFEKMIRQWEKLNFSYILAYLATLNPKID